MKSKLLSTTRTSVIYFHLSQKNFSYVHGASSIKFVTDTIGQLVDKSAEKYGSTESCVDVRNNVRLTFEQVHSQATELASGLLALGFKPGDRLGIWGPNSAQWQITSLAACKAGLIMVDLNPAYQSQEILNCIKKVNVKGIVADETFKTQNYYNLVKAVLPEIGETAASTPIASKQCPYFTHLIIDSEKSLNGAFRLKDVAQSGNRESLDVIDKVLTTTQPDDGCLIQFTSGTTGFPKAAFLSHFNIVNNSNIGGRRLNFHKNHQRIAVQVPYFHVFGHVYGILTNLLFGSTLINASPTFEGEATMNILDKEKVTSIYGTPTMHADIVHRASQLSEDERRRKFATVDYTISGGASISRQLMKALQETLYLKKAVCAYGMTETSPATFLALLNEKDEEHCYNTVGHIMDHVEATELASGLLALGFKPGDRLGIWGPNSAQWQITSLAACKAGLIMVGVYGTPTMYVDVLAKASRLSEEERREKFKSLEFTVSGGASISPDLLRNIREVLGLHRSMQVYGMTETSPVTFLHPADNEVCRNTAHTVGKVLEHTEVRYIVEKLKSRNTAHTVGNVLEHIEVKVVDSDNRMVPYGQQGELCNYVHGASSIKFVTDTIGQLVDKSAEKYGSTESCVDVRNNVRLTFEQVHSQATELASGLLALGFKPGDRLGIWGPNSAQWQITSLAACKAGLIMIHRVCIQVPFFHIYGHVIGILGSLSSGTTLVVPSPSFNPDASLVAFEKERCTGVYGTPTMYVDVLAKASRLSEEERREKFKSLEFTVSGGASISPDLLRNIREVLGLHRSMGTTGFPKAAFLSHFNIVNNSNIGGRRLNFHKNHQRIAVQVPYFHVFGHVYGILTNLLFGSTLINASPTFEGEATMNILDKEKVTSIYGTPTMHADIVHRASQLSEDERRRKFATVDYTISGGASISRQLMKALQETLYLKKAVCAYGMTETSPATFLALLDEKDEEHCYNTVGYIMDHIEAKVVDHNNRIVPFGTPGELLIRGHCNMLGYWEDEQKTKETIGPDRWLRTGLAKVVDHNNRIVPFGTPGELLIRGHCNMLGYWEDEQKTKETIGPDRWLRTGLG
ncbi:uncharacterized protein LOC103513853 [Diaphorina citri]|uniref:Medium-chain acyl-CoA ligase ACSF2, mitochondrial n=1 Tax=Diaphorina citri TaxID=121845 RepID=A0A3Q0J710_DIACI|nr:uncharacterized protein LOC103513853 [Diaphorina citri]